MTPQTSSGSSEARVGGTGYLQKNPVGFVVVKGFNNSGGGSMALSFCWAKKKKRRYFPWKILVGF